MNVARQLAWWCQQLQLQILGDTLGILPRVESGLRQLAGQDRSPNTLNRYLAALHGFVAWCRERDYLHEDPLQHLTWLPTTPRVRRRAMTLEEMQRLLEVCHPERGLVYQTALMTGLRANELRQLSLEHLDVERCGLRLDADWTKNRQPEFQLLPRALVGALEASARSGEPQRCYARHYARAAGTLRISYPDIPLLFVPRGIRRPCCMATCTVPASHARPQRGNWISMLCGPPILISSGTMGLPHQKCSI